MLVAWRGEEEGEQDEELDEEMKQSTEKEWNRISFFF